MSTSQPLVSVVVPTRNSAAWLETTLSSIKRQSYPRIELIVVDNQSTDGTLALAGRYADSAYTRGPERSAQRNYGVSVSRGEYLLMIDSDMELDERVVEECIAVATVQRDVGAIVIPEISVGEGFWAACKALERSCYDGDEAIEAARFFRREVFEAVGGYDERMSAMEDWDIHYRVQKVTQVGRIRAPIHHHEGRLGLWDTARKKYYYGRHSLAYLREHPQLAARQLTPLRPAFLRHWRRLIRHPGHLSGMMLMKGVEFAAGGAGFLGAGFKNRVTLSQ